MCRFTKIVFAILLIYVNLCSSFPCPKSNNTVFLKGSSGHCFAKFCALNKTAASEQCKNVREGVQGSLYSFVNKSLDKDVIKTLKLDQLHDFLWLPAVASLDGSHWLYPNGTGLKTSLKPALDQCLALYLPQDGKEGWKYSQRYCWRSYSSVCLVLHGKDKVNLDKPEGRFNVFSDLKESVKDKRKHPGSLNKAREEELKKKLRANFMNPVFGIQQPRINSSHSRTKGAEKQSRWRQDRVTEDYRTKIYKDEEKSQIPMDEPNLKRERYSNSTKYRPKKSEETPNGDSVKSKLVKNKLEMLPKILPKVKATVIEKEDNKFFLPKTGALQDHQPMSKSREELLEKAIKYHEMKYKDLLEDGHQEGGKRSVFEESNKPLRDKPGNNEKKAKETGVIVDHLTNRTLENDKPGRKKTLGHSFENSENRDGGMKDSFVSRTLTLDKHVQEKSAEHTFQNRKLGNKGKETRSRLTDEEKGEEKYGSHAVKSSDAVTEKENTAESEEAINKVKKAAKKDGNDQEMKGKGQVNVKELLDGEIYVQNSTKNRGNRGTAKQVPLVTRHQEIDTRSNLTEEDGLPEKVISNVNDKIDTVPSTKLLNTEEVKKRHPHLSDKSTDRKESAKSRADLIREARLKLKKHLEEINIQSSLAKTHMDD